MNDVLNTQATITTSGALSLTSLPTEVIERIFECCLPSGEERVKASLHRLAPLVLTWVCRTWRTLCLSLPLLWAELAIGHKGTDPEEDMQVLETWITRSGPSLPISLKLNYEVDDAVHPILFERDKDEKYTKGMTSLLTRVTSCVQRWSIFEVHVLDISVLHPVFLSLVTRGAPCLKRLAFSTKYLGFFGDVHELNFVRCCPSLRSVCISNPVIAPTRAPFDSGGTESDPAAVLRNVTKLELRFCSSIAYCLKWLDISPALEDLTVRFFCSTAEWEREPDPNLNLNHDWARGTRSSVGSRRRSCRRYLPKLKNLEVHSFSAETDAVGAFLDMLDLPPELKKFTINMYDMFHPVPSLHLDDRSITTIATTQTRRNRNGDWTPVLDLLQRSQILGPSSLETFKLLGTPASMDIFVEYLRLIPSLKHLVLGTSLNTDVLLKALTISEDGVSSNVLPKLKSLDLSNCSSRIDLNLDLLASLISCRCRRPIGTLEELHLSTRAFCYATKDPRIQEFITDDEEGENKKGLRGLRLVEHEAEAESGVESLVKAFSNPEVVFV